MFEFFRYFKGEMENPFEGVEQNKAMLWFYEQCYSIVGDERGLIDEYRCYVKEYREGDGVPEGYKALLFNRYMKMSFSVVDSIPDFKAFYEEYYG